MNNFFEISPYFGKLLWFCRILPAMLIFMPIVFTFIHKRYDRYNIISLCINAVLCLAFEFYVANVVPVGDVGAMLIFGVLLVAILINFGLYCIRNERNITGLEITLNVSLPLATIMAYIILFYSVCVVSQAYYSVYRDHALYISESSDSNVVDHLVGQSILTIYDSKDKIPGNTISSHELAHIKDDGSIDFDIVQISLVGIKKIHPIGRKEDVNKLILDYAFRDGTDGINPDIRMICEIYYIDDKLKIRKAKVLVNYKRYKEILSSEFAVVKSEGDLIISEDKRKALQKEISDSEK